MNRMMNEKWPWIEAAHRMRSQLFNILSDADLAFSPGGQTMTLGALCRQMGETEHAYIQSLKTLNTLPTLIDPSPIGRWPRIPSRCSRTSGLSRPTSSAIALEPGSP